MMLRRHDCVVLVVRVCCVDCVLYRYERVESWGVAVDWFQQSANGNGHRFFFRGACASVCAQYF